MPRFAIPLLVCAMASAIGCNAPEKPATAEARPQPTVPADVQMAADMLLGKGSEVLAVGDLAQNGHRQALVVNRVKNAAQGARPGVPFTRAAILQQEGAKWSEVLRCDEYLKNPKGFLGGASLAPTTGWRLQFIQNGKGKPQDFYFTPLEAQGATPMPTIAVRWNPKVERYQSVDRASMQFLSEVPELEMPKVELR
jgi:hypothetical protein